MMTPVPVDGSRMGDGPGNGQVTGPRPVNSQQMINGSVTAKPHLFGHY